MSSVKVIHFNQNFNFSCCIVREKARERERERELEREGKRDSGRETERNPNRNSIKLYPIQQQNNTISSILSLESA